MAWQPQAEGLNSLVDLLRNSTCPDNAVQIRVREQLESFNKIPDYNNYLAYILSSLPDVDPSVRTIAGLTLKNNIRSYFENIQAPVFDYVKECAFRSLADQHDPIRNTGGTVLTTMVSRDLKRFPDVIPKLLELTDHTEVKVVEGAFSAIQKICEDSCRALSDHEPTLLQTLIPKCIQFFKHPSVKVRIAAVNSVNQFVLLRTEALMVHLSVYVTSLYQLTGDENEDIRKAVCQAFVLLLEVRVDAILPEIDNVVQFMLFCTQHNDESVALEACEFWLTFAEQDELRNYLQPYLPKLIPVLLKGMIYSEEDIILLGGDEDDADVPDSIQDIKPRHHKAKTHDQAHENDLTHDKSGATSKSIDHLAQQNEDDDFEDDDDDEDEDDMLSEWNLRKCSAATVDVLSTVFHQELLSILLPYLKEELFHSEWEHRESGILALGAVADGCMDGMIPHLPTLVPILINTLNDTKPLVRSIACWTLSRYISWVLDTPANVDPNEHRLKHFQPLIENLLRLVLDNNKRVQEAACSAFATLEEEASTELIPFLEPILRTFSVAFKKYQHKNLLILYDAVGTLADSVSSALSDPKYIDLLMPPLVEKWSQLSDDDRDLFPLLECLSSVAVALGPLFANFAKPIWERCLRLIQMTLQMSQAHAQDPYGVEEPDKDFMVVALDLISGIVQGLQQQSEALIQSTAPPLSQLLLFCMKDPLAEVRQSAYALIGDLAIHAFGCLKPHLHVYMPELITQIEPRCDPMRVSVCNNATWAAGEIALQYKEDVSPFVNPILERLIAMLNDPTTARTLTENAAITIGRIGFVCPQQVAPHLELFIESWCKSIAIIRDNQEKESAYMGLCRMIEINPNGVLKAFAFFCDAIVAWNRLSPTLNEYFSKILNAYKQMLGDQWEPYKSTFPAQIQHRLRERYGL